MTEIQLPLHQNPQKGMNGKFLPKNTLEIRGGGVGNSNGSNSNELVKNSNTLSQTGLPTKKQSLKLLDKSPSNLANIQVYPIKINSNTEKLDTTFSTFVSVNFIDVKSTSTARNKSNSNRTNTNNNANKLLDTSFTSDLNVNHSINMTNINHINSQSINNNNNSSINNSNNGHHHWHDESNSGWTSTGVMSDRSSVYSIDDGDFDREASRKVGNQLRAIESVLYEQTSTDSSYISECKEWLEKFPHIRILGSQISNYLKEDQLENTRSSVQSLPSTYRNLSNSLNLTSSPFMSSNSNLKNLSDASISQTNAPNQIRRRENTDLNNQGLYLNGFSLPIRKITQDDLINNSEEFSFLEEEIFEQEGTYEELLAYDNQEEEYIFEHNKRLNLNKRRKHGLPPITPKASMKDLVTNFLFDHMWSELIDWSMGLIKEYARTVLDNDIYYDTPPKISQPTELPITIQDKNSIKLEPSNVSNTNILYTNLSQNPYLTTNITKASVVQLKPFDPPVNNNPNNSIYSLIDKQIFTPGLSRDNSILYNQSNQNNKINHNTNNNSNNSNENSIENRFGYSESVSTVGELIPASNFGDLLKIKQLNRHGFNNVNKNLAPIVQNRIGSGSRKPANITSYKKRYPSIEMSSNPILDKNIIIHGAGLGKPSTLVSDANQINDKNSTNGNNSNNSFYPLSNLTTGVNQIQMNRSNNNSSQAYHTQANLDEHNNSYENDYSDYNYNNFNDIAENSIDEINILNSTNNNLNRNYYYNNNHMHYNHGYLKPNSNHPQLPPIGSSLTSKPLRISSANNLKITKEKNERPMTSTATRHENLSVHKRSTTPSGQVSANKALSNLYPINMKITGIRLSSEEPFPYSGNNPQPNTINTLTNFLSTKSFASINGNNNNNYTNITNSLVQQTANRRNSIKDSQGFQRIHK